MPNLFNIIVSEMREGDKLQAIRQLILQSVTAGLDEKTLINEKNEEGETPLFTACECGMASIVDWLLRHGAKINEAQKDGISPLWIATYHGKNRVVERLLKEKREPVDVNQSNSADVSPLFIACGHGNKVIAEMLLKRGALVDTLQKDHRTALWMAAFRGHADIVRLLLSHGANIAISFPEGLNLAQENRSFKISEVIFAILEDNMRPMEIVGTTVAVASSMATSGGGGGGGGGGGDGIAREVDDVMTSHASLQILSTYAATDMSLLAETSLGSTYKVKQKKEFLVVKEISHIVITDLLRDTLLDEAHAMRRVDSSYILPILAICIAPANFCFITKYMMSGSLSDIIHNPAFVMTWPARLQVAESILKALSALHAAGRLHGNLKCNNVLFDARRSVQLSDDGFPTLRRLAAENIETLVCTAPEVLEGSPKTTASDIYACGVILCTIATFTLPMSGKAVSEIRAAILEGRHDEVHNIPARTPRFFSEMIRDCWLIDPRARPTAMQLQKRLEERSHTTAFSRR